MKAYLEKINGEWLDDFVYMSRYPLEQMGFEIVPFDGYFELEKLDNATDEDVCFGSVQATNYFFKAIGIEAPSYLGYPDSLKAYYGRKIHRNVMGSLPLEYPFFVKPANGIKLFTGDVVENGRQLDILKNYCGDNINDKTEVFVSEVLDIKSEFRCFVFEGKLMGIRHYQGECDRFPNPHTIKQMIRAYKDSPVAYTLDVGVVDTPIKNGTEILHTTVVVEVNDMWAIGSYGFDSKSYVLMCVRRMREIQGKLIRTDNH